MQSNNNDENDNNDNNNNGGIGVHPACAPCKHQRKKCTADCVLAPYFPSDRNDEFQSVKRVCGVKILTKMIKNVEAPEDRRRLAESVIWVAGCWDEDPVQGALGKYRRSQQQVEELRRENAALKERINNQTYQLQLINGQAYNNKPPPGPGIGNGWAAANYTPSSFPNNNNSIGSNRNLGTGRSLSGNNNINNVVGYGRPGNGYLMLHHQDHPYGGVVVSPQNYHVQDGREEKVKLVAMQQQQLQLQQQQLSPNGYPYYQLPGQFNGNIMDDTQWDAGT